MFLKEILYNRKLLNFMLKMRRYVLCNVCSRTVKLKTHKKSKNFYAHPLLTNNEPEKLNV